MIWHAISKAYYYHGQLPLMPMSMSMMMMIVKNNKNSDFCCILYIFYSGNNFHKNNTQWYIFPDTKADINIQPVKDEE